MTNVVLILVMILAMILGFLFTMSLVGLITRPRDKKHRPRDKKHRGIAGKNRKRDHGKNAEGNYDGSAGRHNSDI